MSNSKPPYLSPTGPSKPESKPFKIEAVVVCASHDDFLAETLAHNKQMFDRIVVVTSKEDKKTQRICEFHNVQVVATDVLQTKEGKFCKGAGINAGLDKLDKDGWVVQMDADIWLPPLTRILLQQADLDPTMIYGTDRFIVPSFEAWREFIEQPKLQHENNGWVHMNAFKLGTRVMSNGSWLAIGFTQIWHPGASGVYRYPEGHTNAGHEDGLFSMKWPRNKRGFIPEITGYHLESELAPMGANWTKRQTKRFTLNADKK